MRGDAAISDSRHICICVRWMGCGSLNSQRSIKIDGYDGKYSIQCVLDLCTEKDRVVK